MMPFQHPAAVAPRRRSARAVAPSGVALGASAATIVSAAGVRKRFGSVQVLDGVDLQVPAGRVTALIGPNASGKTTLIKIILGLVRPDAGTLAFRGQQIGPADVEYRAEIGYMPQGSRLPETMTGRQMLDLLRDLRPGAETDEELLGAFGLEEDLGRPIRTRSGGTRQKINAAAAFLFRPALVLLDEPTAGLDPLAAGALKEKVLRERDRGMAVLLTSHVTSELDELADDIVFLHDGRVRFAGSVAALRERAGEQRIERAVARLMTPDSP